MAREGVGAAAGQEVGWGVGWGVGPVAEKVVDWVVASEREEGWAAAVAMVAMVGVMGVVAGWGKVVGAVVLVHTDPWGPGTRTNPCV